VIAVESILSRKNSLDMTRIIAAGCDDGGV
jgi:hypothetical protein